MDGDSSIRVILLTRDVYNVVHDAARTILGDDDYDHDAEKLKTEAMKEKRKRGTVRLQRVYRHVGMTLDIIVRLIRAYRRQLLTYEDSVLAHVDAAREHVTTYDHHASSNGLIARCTVIAIEHTRELLLRIVRDTIKAFAVLTAKTAAPSLSPQNDDNGDSGLLDRRQRSRAKARASFFMYIHKKILNRAAWLVSQQTIERQGRQRSPTNGEKTGNYRSRPATGNTEPQLACHVCRRVFDKTFHYLQHIRVHYRLNLYLCTFCNEAFVQQNGLNYHVKHCCPVATATTKSTKRVKRGSSEMTEHSTSLDATGTNVVTINGVEDNALHHELCDSCGRFYENGRELRNHVLRCHAVCNIDLGINRTQQEYIRTMLSAENEEPASTSSVV